MKKNELEGMRRHRLGRWVVPGVLMLTGALGVGWLAWGNRGDIPTVASPDAASLSAGPSASAPLARQQGAFAPDTAVATATAAASTPGSAASKPASKRPWGLSPEELDQYEKQWCSHGHAAHQQAQAAVDRAYPLPSGNITSDNAAMDARSRAAIADPAYQARFGMRRRLVQMWMAQLNARGDARSRAAAAFVGLDSSSDEERIGHIRTLRALAEGSQDPLIWQLWRIKRRHCGTEEACGPASLKPWQDIEPSNLLAWLPVFLEPSEIPPEHWAGIRKASYARSYEEDFMSLLLPLLAQDSPGLALQEGLNLVTGMTGFWPTMAATSSLLRSCTRTSPPSDANQAAACLHAAELLWTMPRPNLEDRLTALKLAAAQAAHDQPPWAARVAFMQTLDPADGERYLSLHFRNGWDKKGCDAQAAQREQLQTIARMGEWEALLGAQRAARTP